MCRLSAMSARRPIVRELGGAWRCFAHNGDLKGAEADSRFHPSGFRLAGATDSEQAFCPRLGIGTAPSDVPR